MLNKKQIHQRRTQFKKLLTRGVEKVILQKNLEQRLLSNEKLNLKLGIDPTGTDIHIGHMVVLRKMREFQRLGHKIIIIVGDYTARIGDPTGRDKMREPLTLSQVYKNMETYQEQIGKILDLDKTRFAYQSEWFDDVNLADILEWAGIFTVQQMIERNMYQRRLKKGQPIGVHEFLYPLMQGYDSVAIKADVEFGGTDQEFNLLIGRTMQEHFGQRPQDILTTSLLVGTDGRKMSKTYKNYIAVTAPPNEMFGKVMSAIDSVIPEYFKLCTDVPMEEVLEIKKALESNKANPRDLKIRLAKEIVSIYYSKKAAIAAEQEFERVFKEGRQPSNMPEFKALKDSYQIIDLLIQSKMVKSKSQARRLIEQGGVKIDDSVILGWDKKIKVKNGQIIQVGKRRFVKIKTV